MRKRWRGVLLLVVACAALAGVAGHFLRPNPQPVKLSAEAYERVKVGMARAEVEAVVGVPPGDYRRRPGRGKVYSPLAGEPPASLGKASGLGRAEWWHDEHSPFVWVDGRGQVAGEAFNEAVPPPPGGPLDELKAWFGW